MIPILELIGRDTKLTRVSSTHGGEYKGKCPLCPNGGTDRFIVQPEKNFWFCLGPKWGRAGCDRGGDLIQYVIERFGVGYRAACAMLGVDPDRPKMHPLTNVRGSEGNVRGSDGGSPSHPFTLSNAYAAPLLAPSAAWQAHGCGWVSACAARLWQPEGRRVLNYLHERKLCDETLRTHVIGYNPSDRYEAFVDWGLPEPPRGDAPRAVWLPRGIVIPWFIDRALWRINVRRPLTAQQSRAGQSKYIGPAGFANGLYNVGAVDARRPVVLVEGEFDALTVQQVAGDRAVAVATGSTSGSRRPAWVNQLAQAPLVLVAFDVDANGAGDQAADWWIRTLPNARRWRPTAHDVNAMAVQGHDVAAWVENGVAA